MLSPVCAVLFQFDPKEPLDATSEWYNAHPSKNEKIHCLVCVVSANNIIFQKTVAQKMRDIRQQANKLGKNILLQCYHKQVYIGRVKFRWSGLK